MLPSSNPRRGASFDLGRFRAVQVHSAADRRTSGIVGIGDSLPTARVIHVFTHHPMIPIKRNNAPHPNPGEKGAFHVVTLASENAYTVITMIPLGSIRGHRREDGE
jgi:hypothetical protein